MGSISRTQLVAMVKETSIEGKTVLDVGSGADNNYARNWAKGIPLEYETLDINPDFKTTHTEDLNEEINLGKKFDVIYCLETLEHIWNPVQAIDNLMMHLKKGGMLYISTPFINPIHDTHDYLRFTGEWYEKVFDRHFNTDLKITPRVATRGNLQKFYADEGLRMSKIRIAKGDGYKIDDIGYFVEVKN